MSKQLLSHWESVELFCRLICKAEKKDLSVFKDTAIFKNYLEQSTHDSFCNKITKAIYKGQKTKANQDKGGRVFFNLSRAVRWREPFMPSASTLNELRDFIRDPEYVIRTSTIAEWEPSQKKNEIRGYYVELVYF